MHAYCIYGRAENCKSMALLLEKKGAIRAFSPQVVQNIWKQGIPHQKKFDLLTGYVFAFYQEPLRNFQPFYDLNGFVRRLGERTMNFELTGNDLDFALTLYDEDGVLKTIHAVWDGETMRLEDEILNRLQARIIRLDRRKKRAMIEYTFENILFTSWIALEVEDVRIDSEKLNSGQK